jgi:hypothetical protein
LLQLLRLVMRQETQLDHLIRESLFANFHRRQCVQTAPLTQLLHRQINLTLRDLAAQQSGTHKGGF